MKKEKVELIVAYLDELFPEAHCELLHSNELELLIAVVLSAQTTDQSVNKITPSLFSKYKNVEDYANAALEDLQNDIRSIGLYRNKAKSIKGLANEIMTRFHGVVPSTKEELETLPGVGRKTANVVGAEAFNIPGIAVDTHVERIAKRLGFAKKEDSVLVVENKLMKAIAKERWIKTHHQFIFFGRYFCKATNPNCSQCKLYDICKESKRKKRRELKN